ncbi:MAG: hypothetical protein JRE16_09120, partial [Deltaproteobacteria bacterium]|nr:hypothetical protein [Deltaproteobacteria bacterium]
MRQRRAQPERPPSHGTRGAEPAHRDTASRVSGQEAAGCCPPAPLNPQTPSCSPAEAQSDGCGQPADDRPGYKLWPFVCGWADTGCGQVPQVTSRLNRSDIIGHWQMRWGFGRLRFSIAPGLYAIGDPDDQSDVVVTANYKMTFDLLRRALDGRNLWILVLDTKGINVWCAAGKGTFGTTELVNRVESVQLDQIVAHRRLIVPQLGAVGVSAHAVKKGSGFAVVYGPVRAEDLPAFLDSGCQASQAMRRVSFGAYERLVLTPVETAGELGDAAGRAEEILRRDLDFSDRFEMIPVPEDLGSGTAVNYGLWNQLGAVWLVTGQVSGSAAAPVLRVSLHDVVFGELKEVRAFSLPAPGSSGFRMAVHRVSDEIVRWATGQPGIAATRIAFRRRAADGASDIWMVDSDGENLRRLTRDSSIVYSPALHPSGDHLLYVSYVSGVPVVYERNLETGAVRTISAEQGLNITPVYSPDGGRILYGRTIGDHTELFELQRQPLCCGRRVTYTNVGETLNADYSPDGRRIAIT